MICEICGKNFEKELWGGEFSKCCSERCFTIKFWDCPLCQLHRPFAEISKIPTADVVQVVRCKDCAVPHNRWTGCPKLNGLVTAPNFYCSYGERRK